MSKGISKTALVPTVYSLDEHNIRLQDFSPHALFVVSTLRKAGYTAYLVGGCIRDLLLKTTPKDFDVSTSARPEEVKALFRNCILVGKRFRLAHIRFSNIIIEVSTFRAGNNDEDTLITKDNSWGTPEEDVLRRDFTINGLFYDPENETIIDYTGGVADLRNRYLRTIGDPVIRFKQDPVRMLRLIKLLSRFSFTMSSSTKEALVQCRYELTKSSPARVFEEVIKFLQSGFSETFFKCIVDYHFLEILFPYMSKVIHIQPKLKTQILAYLKVLDQHILQKKIYERHVLMAIFLFPIVHVNVGCKYRKHPSVSIATVFEYIRNFIFNFFSDSFGKSSKKNFILITLILQMQYRLTPLNQKKKLTFNKKLLVHPKFAEYLTLLEIRSQVSPHQRKPYLLWLKHYEHAMQELKE